MISSSADEIINNASFKEIVAMGDVVIPLIIDELKKRPDFLVAALCLITGENPMPPNSAGNILKMTESWLDWHDHNR
ncbi:hypothetical protein [Puniceibacterium sp. IMCC21224]|uniref:hypothetical protein n=1 Tax=Puniceibacterium sp. IMCC21224 TaxID=1618204 RepID=UPI00065D208E|nr:hypothetical protein [Puniceibacterium sp. IMCC21224]KMK67147.1 hypothetical protein IMCC21224_112011 [Puniceibacterium sp. IMCC21224]